MNVKILLDVDIDETGPMEDSTDRTPMNTKKKREFRISKQLLDEAIGGLKVYGGEAVADTVRRLNAVVQTKM